VNLKNPRLAAFALLPLTIAVSSGAQKSAAHDSASMTLVKPETVGFSSERLENLHALIQGEIDRKELAGAVTILARHGKVVDYRTYGLKDMAADSPMTKDTIFRNYSMTEPVTGVAMMILYEQGRWLPMDPIAKYIPQFEHLKVFNGVDGDGSRSWPISPMCPPCAS
jgi:CubicO group peptidase (beta-lactamase class C family)